MHTVWLFSEILAHEKTPAASYYEKKIADKENLITAASLGTQSSVIKSLSCQKEHKTKNCCAVTNCKHVKQRKKENFTFNLFLTISCSKIV